MGVAIGEKTYEQLVSPARSSFTRQEVELKGYDVPSTAWTISFDGLQRFLLQSGF
jgi:hypothetical protein